MCQYCGSGDYVDLDEDLREMAQDDASSAYAEQAYRDAERERQAKEVAVDDDDSRTRSYNWTDQAHIHEQIGRDRHDNS